MALRPAWLTMLLVFFGTMVALGAIPGNTSALSASMGDKTLHLLAYGFMTFLCFRSLKARHRARSLATLLIIAFLGLLDESLQSLLPYRNASLADWCFDMAAAGTVILLLNFHQPASIRKP
jgi:VanZ family protein